ncbi:glucan endo-1,3-alpha-glucosidase, partial [Tremellales sp. Uapishka_1]
MQALKNQWNRLGTTRDRFGQTTGSSNMGDTTNVEPRLVVAHFMLGNTFPYTTSDWEQTFDLAQATSLDGLALNLGREDWQLEQALKAFDMISSPTSKWKLKLFVSLDMNSLSGNVEELVRKGSRLMGGTNSDTVLRVKGQKVMSTFGGHAAVDWAEVLGRLEAELGEKIFFMPAFFMPSEDFVSLPLVDGTFAWNNAWPMGNHTINLDEDAPFLRSNKPYMAAVSPGFSTHYGTEGEWAFNKNWIYRSDDLLLPTRFLQLLSLPPVSSPAILQIVSFNDYGESHHLAPVLGAEPGSQSWTADMPHDGLRDLTRYFIERWRDGKPAVEEGSTKGKLWIWYRTQSKDMVALEDPVGRPRNADWAQDLINVAVTLPPSSEVHHLRIQAGSTDLRSFIELQNGQLNLITVPFRPGKVVFSVTKGSGSWPIDNLLREHGREIVEQAEKWNFNFWSAAYEFRVGE